jgi:hypothetical protein
VIHYNYKLRLCKINAIRRKFATVCVVTASENPQGFKISCRIIINDFSFMSSRSFNHRLFPKGHPASIYLKAALIQAKRPSVQQAVSSSSSSSSSSVRLK